ncbi:MAG: tetratricopeptide repeat protein [Candidatus Aminicenantes bacterium]|nr:tetratricopeptide repeat protein [Candidatus Aminicenantes bacterium]
MGRIKWCSIAIAILTLPLLILAEGEMINLELNSHSTAPKAQEESSFPQLEMLKLINKERQNLGLPLLKLNLELSRIAQHHCEEIAEFNKLTHTSPVYGYNLYERIQVTFPSVKKMAENVGVGRHPLSAHQRFMDSPAHRKNILDPEFKEVGIGIVRKAPLICYFTLDFITRPSAEKQQSTSRFYFEQAPPEDAVPMTREVMAVYTFTAPQEEELVNKGIALYLQGKIEEAIQAYKKALEINSSYFYAYYNLGLAYVAQEKFLLALENFQEVIKREPGEIYSLYYIGYINSRLGNYQPALDALKELLIVDPTVHPEILLNVHYLLGEVYDHMGKKEEAITYYEKFIDMAKQSPHADLKTVSNAVKRLNKLKEK